MARRVVVDASVVLRLVLDGSSEAEEILRGDELAAPAVLVSETANGLANAVRFAELELEDVLTHLDDALGLPIELVPDAELAAEALAEAVRRGLTAYDAAYVALAERLQAPLVTADRGLAERYERSELIP
jgi:predicted nucleic acid-binding protein